MSRLLIVWPVTTTSTSFVAALADVYFRNGSADAATAAPPSFSTFLREGVMVEVLLVDALLVEGLLVMVASLISSDWSASTRAEADVESTSRSKRLHCARIYCPFLSRVVHEMQRSA